MAEPCQGFFCVGAECGSGGGDEAQLGQCLGGVPSVGVTGVTWRRAGLEENKGAGSLEEQVERADKWVVINNHGGYVPFLVGITC